MDNPIQIIQCSTIGVSGTTPVHVREISPGLFEARMGGSMMGHCNMREEEFVACDYNPFHPDWRDNYFSGKGSTAELAVEAMKADMKSLSDLLWA